MEGVPKMAIVAAMIMNLLKTLRSTWSWITMEKIVVYTSSTIISCIGENDDAAHPIVYYHLNENSPEESCGYCNVMFRLDKEADFTTRYPSSIHDSV